MKHRIIGRYRRPDGSLGRYATEPDTTRAQDDQEARNSPTRAGPPQETDGNEDERALAETAAL